MESLPVKKHDINKHSVLDFHLTAATQLCTIIVVSGTSFWLMLNSQARVSSGFIRNSAGNVLAPFYTGAKLQRR